MLTGPYLLFRNQLIGKEGYYQLLNKLSQPNPNLNHNLNPNTTKKLGETR